MRGPSGAPSKRCRGKPPRPSPLTWRWPAWPPTWPRSRVASPLRAMPASGRSWTSGSDLVPRPVQTSDGWREGSRGDRWIGPNHGRPARGTRAADPHRPRRLWVRGRLDLRQPAAVRVAGRSGRLPAAAGHGPGDGLGAWRRRPVRSRRGGDVSGWRSAGHRRPGPTRWPTGRSFAAESLPRRTHRRGQVVRPGRSLPRLLRGERRSTACPGATDGRAGAVDGLAVSSRNARLSSRERAAACVLCDSLSTAAALVRRGERRSDLLRAEMARRIGAEPLARLDYVAVVDEERWEEPSVIESPSRALVAARFGETRLIDNLLLPWPGEGSMQNSDVSSRSGR